MVVSLFATRKRECIKGMLTIVHQWSMKIEARAFCSRMPSEMPMDMAMSEAEIEYSSHRHQQKASSICLFHQRRSRVSRHGAAMRVRVARAHLQYQNQYRSKAPAMHAQRWKKAEVANHAMMSVA